VSIDFGRTAQDYAVHRAGFPPSLFSRLAALGIGLPGQNIVDLGTGTGSLARGFALRGSLVVGIDPAEALLEQAIQMDVNAQVSVDYRVGRAEKTGLPSASADVVSAGQCWHWFDRPAAAQEAARILKPDGILLIAHFDWLPLKGNLVAATEALILAHNPKWAMAAGTGLYPQWLVDLGEADYHHIQTFSYDETVPYTHEAWRGRIRASAGVAASLAAEQVLAFDQDLARLLHEDFPLDPQPIPHRVFVVTARHPLSS